MNEGSFDDGNYLVRVRAQVMKRDDSTGGWLPMGGGGLSNVSVRKRPSDEETKHEYLIFGKRICDSNVVLSCPIRKDFQYNKVMPTFHHWRTGDKKYGLTFQTASDARAFDKGVRRAVEDLLEGTGELPFFVDADIGDDDVFMTLELPVDSRSSSGSSSTSNGGRQSSNPLTSTFQTDIYSSSGLMGGGTTTSSPYTHPHANHHHLHRMHFIRPPNIAKGAVTAPAQNHEQQVQDVWVRPKRDENDKIEILSGGEPYSYVQFAKDKPRPEPHDYSYPVVDTFKGKQDSMGSLKKQQFQHNQQQQQLQQPPLLPTKKKKNKKKSKDGLGNGGARLQCRHCLEMFSEDENWRGSCEYAPDGVLACINAATCISCAQCMLYHCMADSEGEFDQHPCSCESSSVASGMASADRDRGRPCHQRWLGLALLSLFVPCLWCYLPLRACHRCSVACGLCGGTHEPV